MPTKTWACPRLESMPTKRGHATQDRLILGEIEVKLDGLCPFINYFTPFHGDGAMPPGHPTRSEPDVTSRMAADHRGATIHGDVRPDGEGEQCGHEAGTSSEAAPEHIRETERVILRFQRSGPSPRVPKGMSSLSRAPGGFPERLVVFPAVTSGKSSRACRSRRGAAHHQDRGTARRAHRCRNLAGGWSGRSGEEVTAAGEGPLSLAE
jgi:hypothetical protein